MVVSFTMYLGMYMNNGIYIYISRYITYNPYLTWHEPKKENGRLALLKV